jgi:hypothetical protein
MDRPSAPPDKPKKPSSVRHTRAVARDRSKRPVVAPPDAQVSARRTELIHPLTVGQVAQYPALGLRERVLSLPVMVALVLSMSWRQVGAVCALVRLLHDAGVRWTASRQVSQHALSQRLRVFPAALFARVLPALLPQLQTRWAERQRPLPPEVTWAQAHSAAVPVVDGSTLDALLRKVGLLRHQDPAPVAGRMTGLLERGSRLPCAGWYAPAAQAHDPRGWPRSRGALREGTLLLFDLGYTNFHRCAQLTAAHVTFVTRAKRNRVSSRAQTLQHTGTVHDAVVWIGSGADRQQGRLLEVCYRTTWCRYLTNARAPQPLPVRYAVALYWQRWRIEAAFDAVKRLLGLAYFWTGAEHGVAVQVWATWLLYAVLRDLTDAVAARLDQPLAARSLEMVYRRL